MLGQDFVARGHDEFMHAPADGFGKAGLAQGLDGPLGAAQLVVLAFDVVDGVVEPQRNLHFGRVQRLCLHGFEVRQAFGQMLLRVIVALGLGVSGQQCWQQTFWWRGPQPLPGAPPGSLEQRF